MDFLSSWYTMGAMFVALLVLIGLMLFLRNNRKDEE
ncbi:hypothetical protein VT84_11795 [Gemmata sp. SH-PL17]|uniref:Uncharacterized protein n=1 Tax=Gemmata massiliana TaxID=1210884 RepID=A0A6P2D5G7_9BACT|nr:hypothetical protein VT84_11795 [Gemmata sp. SH-PL17]VTR96313.1 unnamed protein product [Gemmata massiliana]